MRKTSNLHEWRKTVKASSTHLDSGSNFVDVISDIFLSCPFKWDLCTHNAYKDANFILPLADLVTTPARER